MGEADGDDAVTALDIQRALFTARQPTAQKASGGTVNHRPTEAQKAAGNYAKQHISFQGLPISIENKKGSMRRGVDEHGKPWECQLPADYGYIKRTEGADGDHVDVYIGSDKYSHIVFIVHQHHLKGAKPFDEHKVMLGYRSEKDALDDYMNAFSDGKGKERIGRVETMSVDGFKKWLKSGKTDEPVAPHAAVNGVLKRGKFASGGALTEPPKPSKKEEIEAISRIAPNKRTKEQTLRFEELHGRYTPPPKEPEPEKPAELLPQPTISAPTVKLAQGGKAERQIGDYTPKQAAAAPHIEGGDIVDRAFNLINDRTAKADGGPVEEPSQIAKLCEAIEAQGKRLDDLTKLLGAPQEIERDENGRVKKIYRKVKD